MFIFLLAVSSVVLVVHTVTAIVADRTGRDNSGPITGAVNMGVDSAIPTWFSSAILMASSIALLCVWSDSRTTDVENRRHWLGLAVVLCLLSIDEVATIHERWGELDLLPIERGPFAYKWVVGAGVLLVVFVAAYLPFFHRLDKRTMILFVASGSIFVGGALVIETFNGRLDAQGQLESLRYALQTGVEEFCEFVGASLFLYAVLDVLARRKFALAVAVG